MRGSLYHVTRVSLLNVLVPFAVLAAIILGTFFASVKLIRSQMTENMTRQVNNELSVTAGMVFQGILLFRDLHFG
jgi:uncharacterized protein YneF (UPF0154 family)